jgi:putative tryptophan/tyrosine transport system substrate-binding protein
MKRRSLLRGSLALSFAATAWASHAQATRRARLGFLSGGQQGFGEITIDILSTALAELGWREGDTLTIERRWASGDFARLPPLARELALLRPDVIVATGSHETRSLQLATQDIPVVFMQVVDPVGLGIVASIARPGGNITGFTQGPQILWGKRLDLLSDLIGRRPSRLGWLGNPGNPASASNWADAKEAADRLGAEIVRAEASQAGEIESAVGFMRDRDALLVQWDFLFAVERHRIAELANRNRLPAAYENRAQALAGGLMSYGGDLRENYQRGAAYVDRILKGARPADLPVVEASRFEFVINLKTARALGLTIPPTLLARADEVIE